MMLWKRWGGENVSKSEDIILGWSPTLSLIFAKCSIKYTHRNCLYILWWLDLHGWWETDDGGGTTVVAVAVAAAAVEWLWPIKQIINYLSAAAAVTVGRGEFAFSNQLSLHVILSCQRGFIYNPQLRLQAMALRKLYQKRTDKSKYSRKEYNHDLVCIKDYIIYLLSMICVIV